MSALRATLNGSRRPPGGRRRLALAARLSAGFGPPRPGELLWKLLVY